MKIDSLHTAGRPPPPALPIDKDVAADLMRRSIAFRHGRLAVVRLCIAVHCGAAIAAEHWQYCRGIVSRENDRQLEGLLDEASRYVEALSTTAFG